MTRLRKTLSIISNVFFGAGIAAGIYAGVKTYLISRSLPAGVCPIDPNRTWMYLAIAFLLLSLILSFFEPKKQKKQQEK